MLRLRSKRSAIGCAPLPGCHRPGMCGHGFSGFWVLVGPSSLDQKKNPKQGVCLESMLGLPLCWLCPWPPPEGRSLFFLLVKQGFEQRVRGSMRRCLRLTVPVCCALSAHSVAARLSEESWACKRKEKKLVNPTSLRQTQQPVLPCTPLPESLKDKRHRRVEATGQAAKC